MTNNIGFIFKDNNTTNVLKQLWQTINQHGTEYKGQRGITKSIRGVTLVINNPLDDSKNYPYWGKIEDDWYQENFVRKETNLPPEEEVSSYITRRVDYVDTLSPRAIYPYKYAWRSRYYDLGYGYLKAVITALKSIKYQVSSIKRKEDVLSLIHNTYYFLHPEVLLAVLAWKGPKLINFYLKNPKVLDQELKSNRTDTLLRIIGELKQNPNSRRAIIPSFTYPQIDQAGPASGVPVYQTYQLFINFDKKGKPKSLTSFHLHRSFDANGGIQLDINHDKDWGLIASKQLKLPLEKIVIYGNDVGIYTNSVSNHITQKTTIKDWLFSVTDAYNPKTEDIEQRLSKEIYKKKIEYTLKKIT
ncbi:hypothetical protein HYS97_02575 [Candidatus Daviesbacteria bacterium]|nr:hypothetical protein [Candidatus Daviesbacteria bacterium]